MYISRDLESQIIKQFQRDNPQALILSGIVGVGKTTLVDRILETLSSSYEVYKYSGDDSLFRSQIEQNSALLFDQVSSQTTKRAIIFVDEVQKCESIFDALKIAFDRGRFSFIVSGSNPAYLDTIAKRRLQRRAEYLCLPSLAIPEILLANNLVSPEAVGLSTTFVEALFNAPESLIERLPPITLTDAINSLIENFLRWGGLPLAHLAIHDQQRLREIRLVVERGFEPMSSNVERYADTIRVELAHLHSREFAYQGVFQKTGLRRREVINQIIDDLINHGYLLKKKPLILDSDRRSYLTVYSYSDPGIVSYLKGGSPDSVDRGSQIEGYVHARLHSYLQRTPYKSELWYYKPYQIDGDGKLKFGTGEIDFVLQRGKKLVPIEVKATATRSNIDTRLIKSFVQNQKLACGVILYGGVPYLEKKERLLFWPYWLV